MAGLGLGGPVIGALIAVQRWMGVPRLWRVAVALPQWVCGCVPIRRIRARRRARPGEGPSPAG